MGIWEGKAAPRTVINRVCVVLDQHPSWFAREPFAQGQPRRLRPWGCAVLPGPPIRPFPASFHGLRGVSDPLGLGRAVTTRQGLPISAQAISNFPGGRAPPHPCARAWSWLSTLCCQVWDGGPHPRDPGSCCHLPGAHGGTVHGRHRSGCFCCFSCTVQDNLRVLSWLHFGASPGLPGPG